MLDEAKARLAKLEELKVDLERENEKGAKEIAELKAKVKTLSQAAEEGEKLAEDNLEMKKDLKTLRAENIEVFYS